MKKVAALLALLVALPRAWAEEAAAPLQADLAVELNLAPHVYDDDPDLWDRLHAGFRYSHDFLTLVADMSLVGDEKYEPFEKYMLGRYFYIHNGGLILDFGALRLQGGRFAHHDIVDSPYSLFISGYEPFYGAPGLSTLLADLSYQGGRFTYESRWISLNMRSELGYPDRGANYKVYALQFGDFRFGLQDVAVYFDRSFDAEYFLSPVPHIFTQMFTSMDGMPWIAEGNDNSITGLFAEWLRPQLYLYAQVLVDDIGLDFLIPDFLREWFPDAFSGTKAASKLAWSLGGHYDFPCGRLSFYHAGATKWTFEATYDGVPYGYTYQPATQYLRDPGDLTSWLALDYRDNYVGYLYGENNLAFLVEFAPAWQRLRLKGGLEYVISGSKSPGNPWHDAQNANATSEKTEMFGEGVLEHTISARVQAAWDWRRWTFYGRLRLGGVFNRLALEEALDAAADTDRYPEERWIYRPQEGEHRLIYGLTLGASCAFGSGKGARPPARGDAGFR